jgi:hypothetical protein
MYRKDKIQVLGIFISIVLIFIFEGALFWLHFLGFLIFHIKGLTNSYFDAPFNNNSFTDEWNINNFFERFLFHSLPVLAILKKVLIYFILSGNIGSVNMHYILLPLIIILSVFQYQINSFPFWYGIGMYSLAYVVYFTISFLIFKGKKKEEK